MNSYYKTLLSREYHSGVSIPVLASNYGFSILEIEKAILPKGKSTVTTAVKERVYAPADILKKVKQKQAGKKAAETRRRNKLALQSDIVKTNDSVKKIANVTKVVQSAIPKTLSDNKQIVDLVKNIVSDVQLLLTLIQ